MDHFWHFAVSYWWLFFPIAAMAGGVIARIGHGMRQVQRERHQQQLESMRLESELRTAELQTRLAAGEPVPMPEAAPTPAPAPESAAGSVPARPEVVERVLAEHDQLTARWLDYELDAAKMIAFPLMSDGRQPLTAAFLRAKRTADALRPASASTPLSDRDAAEYRDAVTAFGVAFDVAEQEAWRLRDSEFTAEERKRLDLAQQLLRTATNDAATREERTVAYRRVREELDGLIVLSADAVRELEKKVAGELGPAASGS